MSLAKVTSKGQLTLPKAIRDYLDVHTGDSIEFIIDNKGQVIIKPKTLDVEAIFGLVKVKNSVSVEDMRKAIARTIKQKHGKHARD